jgi:hypothetical protein
MSLGRAELAQKIRIFQIYYDDRSRLALDSAFEPMNNSHCERPDWFEYWPIRSFLQQQVLDEDTYYGFLSPRFGMKTRLSGAVVKSFVSASGHADVITFSPFPDQASFYLNVFEQGESFHGGLRQTAQAFFEIIGLNVDLDQLVMDTRTTVFSNYFVARGTFWRRWRSVFEKCFELSESSVSLLRVGLTRETPYHKSVQMKIFLMERMVSTLLATSGDLRIVNYAPFQMPVIHPKWVPVSDRLIAMDACKRAYIDTRQVAYIDSFRSIQQKIESEFKRFSGNSYQ